MSVTQTIVTALISLWLIIAGCAGLMGQSIPTDPEERDLQVEMNEYVNDFIATLGVKYEEIQWATLVQPVLFNPDTAMVIHWTMPNDAILAIFTFGTHRMLRLTPGNRRMVAAHEVGHISNVCRKVIAPDTGHMTEFDAYIADFYFQLLNEGCADIVAAEMTSYPEMWTLLVTLRSYFLEGEVNNVLNQRILIMEDVIRKGHQHD